MLKTVCLPLPAGRQGQAGGKLRRCSVLSISGKEEQEMFFILFILFGDNGDVGEDKEELCP